MPGLKSKSDFFSRVQVNLKGLVGYLKVCLKETTFINQQKVTIAIFELQKVLAFQHADTKLNV